MPRDYTNKKPLPEARYGRLSVISNAKGGWLCRCDCGTEKIVRTQALKTGSTKSCGCLNTERIRQPHKHGMTYQPIYRLWVAMIDRCYRESMVNFNSYGGRGIKVCKRWHDFENFFLDMGCRPDGHTLDRINPDGDYEPSNCRWASHAEQANNRRNNVLLTHEGKTKSVSEWSRELGIKEMTIRGRLRRGKSVEIALSKIDYRLNGKKFELKVNKFLANGL